MIKKCIFLVAVSCVHVLLLAQEAKKRLPQNINVPTYSHIFPSLSGDGNQMIFLTNYSNSEGFETKYTTRTGPETWEDPQPIPSINRPGQDHIGSFCLSYDGNFVVFASRRTPTIGNYDIWISEKVGKNWTTPVNPGKPLNSPANEGNPSLSPDGKSIYFMRCEKMDATTKSNCAIFVSHRLSATRWSEPEKLPEHINSGHETTPRIMADNTTLVFASGRQGGKGKLDLYQTTLANNNWSQPMPLDYLNTSENDEYISIPARGDIVYYSASYRDQYHIFMGLIPEHFRPKKVLMLSGTITYTDGMKPSDDVVMQVYNLNNKELFTNTRLNKSDDSFTVFLTEGKKYDVSAFPQRGGHSYYSKIIDLENMQISRKETLDVALHALAPGRTIPLSTIRFKPYTDTLTYESEIEIMRISGFLKSNKNIRLEIGAFMDEIITDTIQTADLTETTTDTTYLRISKSNFRENFLQLQEFDSTDLAISAIDTATENAHPFHSGSNALSLADSLYNAGYILFDESPDEWIYQGFRTIYHNNRTQKYANVLVNRLIADGIPASMLEGRGYGNEWSEDRASEERNYWIELRVLTP